eukprot:Lithocolla_globosa_v1_NODE_1505_length_2524_cov_47.443499.p1 type:complete len:412 gc:universal NODE_1505_length_2524_cov_47.443499:2441-1206(-)
MLSRTTSSLLKRSFTSFANVPLGPPDAILGLNDAFRHDNDPNKINLGVGAYRTDSGHPNVLDCVRKAEAEILEKGLNKEYLGITGLPDFTKVATELAYGEDLAHSAPIAKCQSLSGTGALRLGGAFLNRFSSSKSLFLPNPSWGNHGPIFTDSGLKVERYRYFDKATNGLDLQGMLEDLDSAPGGSNVLLHACAHNPTGVDPTAAQWAEISQVIKSKDHQVFFDMAYQGFASGDPDKDAQALRTFVKDGHRVLLAQSFAKNMGLYGERVGQFSIVCDDAKVQAAVESQIKIVVRPMYSNPPSQGARIVATVLDSPELYSQWRSEVAEMAVRIIDMRNLLKNKLAELGSQRNWDHITNQIGMFCFTGLNEEQVKRMTSEFHVYLTKDGRISITGVNNSNVGHLANALHQVTK